jgi:tellurite resistance-related uncharacterized protein
MPSTPYRSTPVFDEASLPKALRGEHRTKAGVWGVITVLEGQLRLTWLDPAATAMLSPDCPGLVLPEQPHFVEPIGAMRMQVDFHDTRPHIEGALASTETKKA